MRKKIRFYKQHTMETCGPACMLMLLDLYRRVEYPTPKQEAKLYSLYRSRAFKGVNGAAIADCLSKNNLEVTLFQSFHNKVDNRDGYYSEELYEALQGEYQADVDRCADRIKLIANAAITCDLLKQKLDSGKQIILQCIVPGNADGIHDYTLHWIVVHGYDGDEFLVCDPLSSKIRITSEAMENYMDTPIGRICIVAGEKT